DFGLLMSCFFSSRRRHTRLVSDWSSDVCSSDLTQPNWADFCLDRDSLRAKIERLDSFLMGDALRIFYRSYAERDNKSRWGDKTRSEERRVGKKRRYRAGRGAYKKKERGRDRVKE